MKDRQQIVQKKMNKRTNDDLQNFLQKTKDRATRTPQKTASERGYIGRVAHGYIWRVAHGYIWRVAHGYIGRVAHGYIGRVASKMMRIISNSVFLLLPRGHEMGISAYYKHNFFGRRYKFESNQCGFGFSSNKWTDGRRRYVLLKRQSQIQLQYVYHHHRICLYILLNYSDFTDNSSAVLLNSVRSNIIHFTLERLTMNNFVDFHLLLYSNWNFHFANVILSFERIDSAFAW